MLACSTCGVGVRRCRTGAGRIAAPSWACRCWGSRPRVSWDEGGRPSRVDHQGALVRPPPAGIPTGHDPAGDRRGPALGWRGTARMGIVHGGVAGELRSAELVAHRPVEAPGDLRARAQDGAVLGRAELEAHRLIHGSKQAIPSHSTRLSTTKPPISSPSRARAPISTPGGATMQDSVEYAIYFQTPAAINCVRSQGPCGAPAQAPAFMRPALPPRHGRSAASLPGCIAASLHRCIAASPHCFLAAHGLPPPAGPDVPTVRLRVRAAVPCRSIRH